LPARLFAPRVSTIDSVDQSVLVARTDDSLLVSVLAMSGYRLYQLDAKHIKKECMALAAKTV